MRSSSAKWTIGIILGHLVYSASCYRIACAVGLFQFFKVRVVLDTFLLLVFLVYFLSFPSNQPVWTAFHPYIHHSSPAWKQRNVILRRRFVMTPAKIGRGMHGLGATKCSLFLECCLKCIVWGSRREKKLGNNRR